MAVLMGSLLLMLCGSLVDGTDDAKVVFRVLEVAFAHHTVTRACRISAELQILLEQLLRRSTNTKIRPVTIENMIAVQRYAAIAATGTLVPYPHAVTAAATTTGTIATMAAATHTFNVHYDDESLSCSQPGQARAYEGQDNSKVARFELDIRNLRCEPKPWQPCRGTMPISRRQGPPHRTIHRLNRSPPEANRFLRPNRSKLNRRINQAKRLIEHGQ